MKIIGLVLLAIGVIGIVLTVLVPTVYSAWLYHKLKKENKL